MAGNAESGTREAPSGTTCRGWRAKSDRLDVAAWGRRPDGSICFVNRHAQKLLQKSAAECIGRPCREVIPGCDGSSGEGCVDPCETLGRLRRGESPGVRNFRVGQNGSRRWLQVVPILTDDEAGDCNCSIEVVVDIDRWTRIEKYVRLIAGTDTAQADSDLEELTPRERQVLEFLGRGMSQHEVSRKLHISYATVRTHVQRILSKMGVRSIQAAVARHLLR